jgi:hypothetical protein
MLEVLFEFVLDLFLLRWAWDDEERAPGWVILLVLVILVGLAGMVAYSTGAW